MLLRYSHYHIPQGPASPPWFPWVLNTRKPWVLFCKLFPTMMVIQSSSVAPCIQRQLIFVATINLKTSLPTSQTQSLLNVHTTKRQWGKGWILIWERIFKLNSIWGSDLAFTGCWHLKSIWCFWKPQVFQCSSVCFSNQNTFHTNKLWPILMTHWRGLAFYCLFSPLWLDLLSLEGTLPFLCLFSTTF